MHGFYLVDDGNKWLLLPSYGFLFLRSFFPVTLANGAFVCLDDKALFLVRSVKTVSFLLPLFPLFFFFLGQKSM